MKRTVVVLMVLVGGMGFAFADSITFFGDGVNSEGGSVLSASALFEISGSQLIITLTNTADLAVRQSDLLAGVMFDLANGNALTDVSATLIGDWTVIAGTDAFTHELLPDVGTEYAYRDNLTGSEFRGAQYGVSANGFGPFGPENRFDTSQPNDVLHKPASPDGANFSLASAIPVAGIPGLSDVPIVVGGAVQFVFDYTGDLSVADISNVNFQYGTSLTDPDITIVPEPSTMTLLGVGIAGFLAARRMRKTLA